MLINPYNQGDPLYSSKEDIERISCLIQDIKERKISRNKNYLTLANAEDYNRFKRAKLMISLLEDLKKTSQINGNRIEIKKKGTLVEISLFNPVLKYNRKVVVTDAELKLIKSGTKEVHYQTV